MKNITLLLPLIMMVITVFAQDETKTEAFYMLDANFKGTSQEKAKYFIHAEKMQDSCWQFDTYNINGPLVSSEQYKDEKGTVANGSFLFYNKKGALDSTGHYLNGLQDGKWYLFSATGKYLLEKEYRSGDLIAVKNLTKKDSAENKKNNAAEKQVKDEKESDFPGGVSGWINYLSSNMVYPQRAQNLVKQGTVVIQFIVDKEGHVVSPEISQSVEYSMDQEALRLIKKSPLWMPAMLDGKTVKSYKKQPITFRLE